MSSWSFTFTSAPAASSRSMSGLPIWWLHVWGVDRSSGHREVSVVSQSDQHASRPTPPSHQPTNSPTSPTNAPVVVLQRDEEGRAPLLVPVLIHHAGPRTALLGEEPGQNGVDQGVLVELDGEEEGRVGPVLGEGLDLVMRGLLGCWCLVCLGVDGREERRKGDRRMTHTHTPHPSWSNRTKKAGRTDGP